MTICSVDGCPSSAQTRGWCEKHYCRWKRHGDPLVAKKRWKCSTDPIAGEKVCRGCGETILLAMFASDNRSGDGTRSRCRSCTSKSGKEGRDPDRDRGRSRRYRLENPEKSRQRVRVWRAKNADRFAATTKAWRATRSEKTLEAARRYYRNKKSDPSYRLKCSMRSMVHTALKGGKKTNNRTFDTLGYTLNELRYHLEAKFLPGMSWNNYGRFGWHVDHVRPLSSFNFRTADDPDFRAAWALKNLQPLWAVDNWKKSNKMPDFVLLGSVS